MVKQFAGVLTLVLILGAMASASVAAQDATPEASPVPVLTSLQAWLVGDPFAPPAAECTQEPVSTDDVADTMATLEPRAAAPVTSDGIIAIDAVGPASDVAIDGVLDTLTQFWACNNAGDRPAMVAVFTPQGIVDLYGIDLEVDDATLRAAVAAALTPGDPRPEEEISGIDGVIAVVELTDGRIAALVLNTDPRIAGGDQVLDLIIFVEENGTYLIDSFIGDPFDQTPGYGFEK